MSGDRLPSAATIGVDSVTDSLRYRSPCSSAVKRSSCATAPRGPRPSATRCSDPAADHPDDSRAANPETSTLVDFLAHDRVEREIQFPVPTPSSSSFAVGTLIIPRSAERRRLLPPLRVRFTFAPSHKSPSWLSDHPWRTNGWFVHHPARNRLRRDEQRPAVPVESAAPASRPRKSPPDPRPRSRTSAPVRHSVKPRSRSKFTRYRSATTSSPVTPRPSAQTIARCRLDRRRRRPSFDGFRCRRLVRIAPVKGRRPHGAQRLARPIVLRTDLLCIEATSVLSARVGRSSAISSLEPPPVASTRGSGGTEQREFQTTELTE